MANIFFFRFGYVDLENADDLDKALELNGSEVDGQSVNIEKAKAKGALPDKTPRQQQQRDSSSVFALSLVL